MALAAHILPSWPAVWLFYQPITQCSYFEIFQQSKKEACIKVLFIVVLFTGGFMYCDHSELPRVEQKGKILKFRRLSGAELQPLHL
jgi:hypothetical protein